MFQPAFIYTDRHFQTWPSWQIVFEWENALSEALHLPLRNSPTMGMLEHKFRGWDNRLKKGNYGRLIHQWRPWHPRWVKAVEDALYFEMAPRLYPAFSNSHRVAPILIDVFPDKHLADSLKYYTKCKRVYFTSLEVLQAVKQLKPGGPWFHFPMSLPDQYRLTVGQQFDKKYPVVLSGRTNPVMLEYLKQFVSEHPDTEYLQQQVVKGKLYYVSNLKGVVGEFSSREAYWQLIRSAKVCFYATPGMDDKSGRTGGFNPLTPRWFELLAAGCHVIARFPETDETRHYKMTSITKSVENYEQFKSQLLHMLESPPPIEHNAAYLTAYYTSKTIPYLELTA